MSVKSTINVLLTCATLSSLCSCNSKVLSHNANVGQLLMGRSIQDATSALGLPKKEAHNGSRSMLAWEFEHRYTTQHYVPGESYTTSSYNYLSDTITTRTTYTPGYSYTRNHLMWWIALGTFDYNRLVAYRYNGNTDWSLPTWEEENKHLLTWNQACASDDLETLQELISKYPQTFCTHQALLAAALQAAKYDAEEVLVYLLQTYKVNIDEQQETWAKGESDDFVLTSACIRDILKSRNSEDVKDALLEIGIHL